MTGRTRSLSIDSRFTHLYRPLVRKLAVIFVVTIVLAESALLFFDARLVESMSTDLIRNSTAASAQRLGRLFDVSKNSLGVAHYQVSAFDLSGTIDEQQLRQTLKPFLETYDYLDSINLADAHGNEFVLIRNGDTGYLTRRIRAEEPDVARWQRWEADAVVESWQRETNVSPISRPWFKGALTHEPGTRFWTEPYVFLTTREPGISVSTRWQPAADPADHVIALNISLIELSRSTLEQRPSSNGMSMIFDAAGRTLGLPRNPQFDDEQSMLAFALKPVDELGIPEIRTAIEAWREQDQTESAFPFRDGNGKRWWAGFSSIALDQDHAVWAAAVIPRSDLVGNLELLRNLSVGGITLLGVLIAAGFFAASMRAIRRQMKNEVDRIEQKLGQYQVEEKIGEGGNGAVYRARHALLRRPTALKLMNPEFSRSEAARERFEHEVRLTSGLSHPNTIAIYDFGKTADGTLYYAMELLSGSTLDHFVQLSGPLPANRTIHFLEQACGSLSEAHGKGLIHRDIKPSNLFVCERGGRFDIIKVLDFGLVKEMAATDGNLTQAEFLVGTPLFMAPETISKPGSASPQSDIYALGAVGYFLLCGRNVFEGNSVVEICAAHLNEEPVPPSQRLGAPIAGDLEAIVLQCLAKDPAARPESTQVLADALLGCADAGSWTQQDARSWWQANAAGALGQHAAQEVPMSRTELIIDMDSRVLTQNAPDAA